MGSISTEKQIDMLRGPLLRPMIAFALPLIASGVLQQSFTAVDIAIAGRFAGHGALAAVGSNGPVIGLIINLFMGIAVGVNVVIGHLMGQRNERGISTAVGASMFLAIVCGLFMFGVSQLVAEPFLTLLDTPEEVLQDAIAYLTVYSVGMPFMLIYNFGAAVLRAIGDTRRPFYSLVFSGFINLGCNIIFVVWMGMGVTGVAWGTVIANIINSAYIVWILLREKGPARLDLRKIRPYRQDISRIARIGLPAGLQSTVFSMSNVLILSAINGFGALAAAGSAAAINFEIYSYFIIVAFVQTAMAFMSQNYGAGQLSRCRRVYRLTLVISTAVALGINLMICAFPEFFLSAFTDDAGVINFATERIYIVLLFQCIACYYEVTSAAMRALGRSLTPALIVMGGTCVLRVIWVALFPADGSFTMLLSVYPVSWMLTNILMFIAYRRLTNAIGMNKDQETTRAEAIETA